MMSRDLERSRSWSQYVYGPLSRKWLEIQTRVQWSTCRKWHLGYRMVIWSMTSRDPKRSRSWPWYIWMQISQWVILCWRLTPSMQISQKRVKIEARFQWDINRKWHVENRMVMWSISLRDIKRSRSWIQYFWGPLFRNGWSYRIG